MKAIRDVLLILCAIVGVIYLIRFLKPPDPIIETNVIHDTITYTDTIYQDSLIIVESEKVKWDTVEVDDYRQAYYRLMDSLNAINKYDVVLKDDSIAYIDIEAKVFANTLYQLNYTYKNRTPTTIINKNYNTRELFVTSETNFNDITISLMYKQDRFMFKSGYDIIGKRPRIGVGYKLW